MGAEIPRANGDGPGAVIHARKHNRTDSGWMMESMLEIFDEHYSRQISADTLRSMSKIERGGYFNGGRVPYGYTAVQDSRGVRE